MTGVRRARTGTIYLVGIAILLLAQSGVRAQSDKLLTGKAAMGDWTSDAPGVRRKITVADLPPPGNNALAINPPRMVDRPAGAELHVPPGFKIDMLAIGFREPRFLLGAPNGDISSPKAAPTKSRSFGAATLKRARYSPIVA